jgi:hypothetical protein
VVWNHRELRVDLLVDHCNNEVVDERSFDRDCFGSMNLLRNVLYHVLDTFRFLASARLFGVQ